MVQNTLLVEREELISNYSKAILNEFLNEFQYEPISLIDLAVNIKELGSDLVDMFRKDSLVAGNTFKKIFLNGGAEIMLSHEQFSTLEKWHANNEDFLVIVFAHGQPICSFEKSVFLH